jgi:hypothetical protein
MDLREAQTERERRNEDDPAADSEQARKDAAGKSDRDDERDRQKNSLTPTTARRSANP